MGSRFDGKVALITGGSRGLGRSAALAFAREGARVAVSTGSDVRGGEETVSLIKAAGGDAFFAKCDISNESDVERFVAATVERYGRIDCAYNNAGSGHPPAPVASIDTAAWRRAIDIVLTGTWLCMKHEIRQMVKQGSGSIVNVASTVGMKGWPYLAGYGAAKAGMIHLTRTAAIETAKQGIRINAISPGPVATEMVASAVRDSPDVEQQILATVPMGRISEPEETIELVLWLSSDKASYVTGANYVLDGGQTA